MKVTILQPTRHDGKRLNPGDVADVSKSAAQALIACGAAEEGGTLKKAAAPTEAEAAAATKAEAIATAQKAVADAQAQLDAAIDDATKALAQVVLDRTTAELAALQA